jgi:small subunit ribosomal protein S1
MVKTLEIKDNSLNPPRVGEIVKGKIIGKGRSSLFLDLGAFGSGIIYGREFYNAKDVVKELKIGDEIFAKITELENEEGYLELSVSQAGKELAWDNLKLKKEKGESLIIKILGANKGGLLTEVSGVPAFLPVSQLSSEHYPRVEGGDSKKILLELQKFVGKDLEVKIFDLDSKEGKLILSEKIKELEKMRRALKSFEVGEVVDGEITAVTDFGAFMKFSPKVSADSDFKENLEGLIHISELDWQIVEDPVEIVKAGEKVQAKIIKIADDKIFLSLKALKKDPWEDIEKKYKKGDVIEGEVIKLNPFGTFVRVDKKIQGLCHVSEFGTQKKMEEAVEVGKNYSFEILSIEPLEHKMSLGFRKG